MSGTTEQAQLALDAGRGDAAVRLLEDGCAAGDADSLFTLGTWYLSGLVVARDRPEAAALLRAAREGGQREAALMEIALVANGSFGPPDWGGARRLLARAAQACPTARAHEALLADMSLTDEGAPLAVLTADRLSQSPDVHLVRAFATPEECAHICAVAAPVIEPSFVVDPETGGLRTDPVRTSDGAVISPAREDLVVRALEARIAAVTGTDITAGEPLSVLRYRFGQQYRPHLDTFAATDNQRVLTAILYLQDDHDGGETQFPGSGLTVRGQAGDLLFFRNILADGRPDPASRHAGLAVTRGEKWIATRWIREKPYDPWAWQPGR